MNAPRTGARACTWLRAAVATFVAIPAWADGELDTTFGNTGAVKIAFPNSTLAYLRDAAVVNGVIEAAGYAREFEVGGNFLVGCTTPFPDLFIVKLSLSGIVIGSPSSHAQKAIKCPSSLAVDSATGDIYVAGYVAPSELSQATAVARFNSAGELVATYSVKGSLYYWLRDSCYATRVLIDNQGRFVALCSAGLQRFAALRLSVVGDQIVGGFLTPFHTFGFFPMTLTAIAQDPSSGAYFVGGAGTCTNSTTCPVSTLGAHAQLVMRLDADTGSPDTSFGSGGVAAVFSVPPGKMNALTLDGSGNAVIAGDAGTGSGAFVPPGYVARLDATGTPDASFGTRGIVQNIPDAIVDVRTDETNRVYALGSTTSLRRFKVNGSPDATFSGSTNIQTLNGPASSWQSMQFAGSSHTSAYLLGGAGACGTGCSNAATTAVIAKVNLTDGADSPVSTTTVLDSSATRIRSGQTVTLTANVTGANPAGTVTFKDGATAIGTAQLTTGRASYSTSSLAVGNHNLTAEYAGDSRNAPSTSPVMTEAVYGDSRTVLAASAATIGSGQSVTFTATVTATNPTGTITFSDGSRALATQNLSTAKASYSTSALSVGRHSISATYSGDELNAASTSSMLVETVNAAPPGSTGSGGGGSFALVDLCVILFLGLWRTCVGRRLAECKADRVTV
jgi:uncharacterized delta-60 repeat protein